MCVALREHGGGEQVEVEHEVEDVPRRQLLEHAKEGDEQQEPAPQSPTVTDSNRQ